MISWRRMGAVVCSKNCRIVRVSSSSTSSRSIRAYQFQSSLINKWVNEIVSVKIF